MTEQLLIREMFSEDKPRERLKTYGAEKLTNQELLGIIINTGNKNESALSLTNKILSNIKLICVNRVLNFFIWSIFIC